MLGDNVDYSLIPYGRRSMIETLASHAGLVVAAPILLWVTWAYVPHAAVNWPASAALYALLLVNISVVAWFSNRAVRAGATFAETDRWDSPTTTVSVLVALSLGVFAGGLAGPVPVLVLAIITYASGVYAGLAARMLGPLIALAIVGVGLVTDTWAGEGFARGVGICTLAIVLATVTDLLTMTMIRAQYDAYLTKRQIADDVERMSAVADEVARGDLAVSLTAVGLEADGTAALASSLDHTLGSLRGLVGRVRVGGEQIGSAASQVLVAAREQAVSASQQSSAVSET
ncbi:MAG TPA: hypothetical protein VMT27_08875, partial [Actinomycetes bacterium]|nr:hypothetical protein [Actinomycetes bacterium]